MPHAINKPQIICLTCSLREAAKADTVGAEDRFEQKMTQNEADAHVEANPGHALLISYVERDE